MKKNILMYLYILLIAGLTFVLVPIFKVMGSTNFLQQQQELLESSDLDLMSGTTLAFRNDGTSSYIKKDPIFSQLYEQKKSNGSDRYKFKIDMYAASEKKGKKYSDGFFILLSDIVVDHPNIILDEEGRNLIVFEMFFDRTIPNPKGKDFESSIDFFVPLYDGDGGILYFDHSALKVDNEYALIKEMRLSVKTPQDSTIKLLSLYNYDLNPDVSEDVFSEDYDRSIANINPETVNVSLSYGVDGILNSGDFYYNNQLRKMYRLKYNYLPYFLVIWIILVAISMYFLFIHKYVVIRIRNKKNNDRIKIDKLKENIKLEERK